MALDGSSTYVAPNNLTEPSESLPIFDVQRVQLQFPIAADFVAAQVANNVLILALSTGRILRIDLDSPEDIDGKDLTERAPLLGAASQLSCAYTRNRYRPSKEVVRDWLDSAHVPGPLGVSSDYHHYTGRKLLPSHAISPAKGSISSQGCVH